ncbi:MAG: sigma-70 family RNA polymerase sigma factor [Phycisphaerales bacterium]|nr:sigma-70 family RNA polymerase sigma factor [Phycisphaerales bacterium]
MSDSIPNMRSSAFDGRSDEEVFVDFRSGDKAAYRELIERYHDDLLRFLTRLVGDRAAAEDLFQETFLQIHLSADTFDASRRFRPWLFTIAANKGRDLLRKRKRRRTVELSAPLKGSERGASMVDLLEIDVPAPDERLDASEQDRLVQLALDDLGAPLREVLVLGYFQRLSYARIAEDLGIPLGTVKSRMHAAVAAFARSWQRVSRPDLRDE